MKKTLLFGYFIILLFGYLTVNVMAQTVTLTPTPAPTGTINKDIENLKEKIANKVLEIRKKNNKAVSGFVVSNDGNQMKINNSGEQNQVKFDDTLTKYFQIAGTQKKEIKADDIEKNDYAIVSGVVVDNVITANVVLIDENLLVDSGKITAIDSNNFNIKVLTGDKKTYSLDIETNTKQKLIDIKTLEMGTIGFSKFKEGDTVHFVVKDTNTEKNNNYSALKILVIPQEYFIK
jgi:hypothetical protein